MGGYKYADHPTCEHGASLVRHGKPHGVGCPDAGAGQPTARPSRGGGNDHSHGALGFHQCGGIHDDPVQHACIDQAVIFHLRPEIAGLITKDPVGILGTDQAGTDTLLHDVEDACHLFPYLVWGEGTPGALIPDSQFSEVKIFIAVVFQHFGAGNERDPDLAMRQNRKHRCDLFDRASIKFGAHCSDGIQG